MADLPQLPVSEVLGDVSMALSRRHSAVLVAPPGAGKTTLVPLHLLQSIHADDGQTILLLEPRRLAARTAAHRMAALLGEQPGQRVGYAMRLDRRVSPQTRILVVTEGVLQRMILDDPELSGIGTIIFDEFHERSVDGDFGLALALDVQEALREDLNLLVMSATLDGARIAPFLGDDVPVIESQGRMYPVEHRYAPRSADEKVEDAVAAAIRTAIMQEQGSILAFLPGQAEITRTAERLTDRLPAHCFVQPLYGAMPIAEQNRAIQPAPDGARKIVLATSIAETSITIDGVRIIIDSGLARVPRFDAGVGVTRLETVRVSKAAADQRAGRAGRTAPGIAIRLWAEPATRALPEFSTPEILNSDLSRLVLDGLAFGVADLTSLRLLDVPPAPALAEARNLLKTLGAIDHNGLLTSLGEKMRALPLPVREAAMVAAGPGEVRRAQLALLLGERGLGGNSVDLARRMTGLARESSPRAKAIKALAARMTNGSKPSHKTNSDEANIGRLLLDGFSDRLAKARGGQLGQFVMANGRAAALEETDPLAAAPYLVIADLTGTAARARILSAASIDEADITAALGARIESRLDISFDTKRKALVARQQRRFGKLTLAEATAPVEAGDATVDALCQAVASHGLELLPWGKPTRALRARLNWLHANLGTPWPAMDDDTLIADMDVWLAPYLAGHTGFNTLSEDELRNALLSRVDYGLVRQMDALAPTHFEVPTGSRIPIHYRDDDQPPELAVRVQELFGLATHPSIGGGKVPLLVELLSPAQRPLQRTLDLPGFWHGSWADVRADMRGRYPKHPWPEDPANAAPTRRVKPRG
ncbi:MAG: ATP-dependent helicase HrpB [Ahrensia sp.]